MAPRRALHLALLALAVAIVGTTARWRCAELGWGPNLLPQPDAVEYAAAAQALARLDGYVLRIGPHLAPPRYPPGWPLLLSAAVRVGVPGESLWRLTGVLGGVLSALVAVSAWLAVAALTTQPGRGDRLGAAAGAAAGLVWALAPLPVFQGQTVLSDEPCLLFSWLGLALLVAGCRVDGPELRGRQRWGLLAASGVLFGVTASMRFVAAALLAPAVVVVASGAVSGPGRGRRFGARLAAVAGGLAITTAAVAGLSGQAPWSWSRYDYWTPRWYADLGDTFRLDYALAGNPDYTLPKGVEPFSHLAFAAEVLLGLPGRPAMSSLGRWWPILGWLGLGWAAWRLSRSGRPVERSCGRAAAALAAWSAGHVVLYSTYFCAYPRFYLGPLAACLLGLVVPVALWAGSGARWRWGGAAAAALLLVAVTADAGRGLPAAPATRAPAPQVRRAFADWLALGDDGRRDRAMPFDPVHAQALGLVTPEVVAGVGEWGRLPLVGHVARLRATGAIAADEVLPVERGGG